MRNIQRLMGLAGMVLACAPACSTKVKGQLMLAVQTDMALPKDIDRIRIYVTKVNGGASVHTEDFTKLGAGGEVRLPATIGFVASEEEEASTPLRIKVVATRGLDAEETVQVLREVVTTIPTDRTVTLPITLEFLCNGQHTAVRTSDGKLARNPATDIVEVESTCNKGQTCVAGTCVTNEVPSKDLAIYAEREVFGGGTGEGTGDCFDTATCFATGSELALDLEEFKIHPTVCRAKATGDLNIALRTQGGGICGSSGCFVALDADGPGGWKAEADGTISFPLAVCTKVVAGELVGVVTTPVDTGSCQKKKTSLPTCGPWSSSGKDVSAPSDPKQATLVAPGQTNPVALALTETSVVWTNRGTFDKNGNLNADGTVKMVPFDGGQPLSIATGQASPHGVVADAARYFILWTNAGKQRIMWAPFPEPGVTPPSSTLIGGLLQPEGLALEGSTVYWTELASQKVYQVATEAPDGAFATKDAAIELAPPTPAGTSPRGIAAVKNAACWTYEDKLMTSGGVVACSIGNQTLTVASGQRTPRAISIGVDADGNAVAVYWANFDARSNDVLAPGGGIWKADVKGAGFDVQVLIAQEDYPAGLALDPDGKTLFWTSRSSHGAVMTWKEGDKAPTLLVKDQLNPGAIVVNAKTVFWINEGATNLPAGAAPDGAIMKVAK